MADQARSGIPAPGLAFRPHTKKRKHSKAEIAAKLAEADDLVTQGKLQSEIARALGVSVMTLHRWRKRRSGSNGSSQIDQTPQTQLPSSSSKIHGCGDW
jgi:transposase-like protein